MTRFKTQRTARSPHAIAPAPRVSSAAAAAETFDALVSLPEGGRLRHIRVVRDYGMFDRREAPQYYPEVTRGTTLS